MQSMTGYGYATWEEGNKRIDVEIRSVNSRFFNFSAKLPVELLPYETKIKQIVNEQIKRGTVSVAIIYERDRKCAYEIDTSVIKQYFTQLQKVAEELEVDAPSLESLLSLPGVVAEKKSEYIEEEEMPVITQALTNALAKMVDMRKNEGRQICQELEQYCEEVTRQIEEIAKIAPQIAQDYQLRLQSKMEEILAKSVTEEDMLKEVAIFAERSDVSEEVARLKSHLIQFHETLAKESLIGKTLDFISQEIIREANTISSKANNSQCSFHVVNIKSCVEKMREQLQNVE